MYHAILLAGFLSQCQYNISYLNANGWININALLIVSLMMIGAVIYAVSGLFSAAMREKLRGVVKFELVDGAVSIMLLVSIFTLSIAACSAGAGLAGFTGYQDPFQFARYYVGNLLFSKGTTLTSSLFSTGIVLLIDGNLVSYALQTAAETLNKGLPVGVDIHGSEEPVFTFYEYNSILQFTLGSLVVVTFGLLFVLFFALPIIQALSLTVVIPVAIIMRALAFTDPRLGEASDAFIAIAIAFYFILPLTIAMNSYIVNWLYCSNGVVSCNPYSNLLGPYKLDNTVFASLFTQQTSINALTPAGLPQLPYNFYADALTSGNGGLINTVRQLWQALIELPQIVNNLTTYTAQYVFEGIVLMALDVAITIGFAIGLSKGLDSISRILGVGPFWGEGG